MQKLDNTLATDATGLLSEEAVHTDAFEESISAVEAALDQLGQEFSSALVDENLLKQAVEKASIRGEMKIRRHEEAVR